MKDIRDIITVSLTENINEVLKDFDNLEIFSLAMYLASTFIDTPPSEKQKVFIKKIFGEVNWAEFIQNEVRRRRPNPPFMIMRPPFDLSEIRAIVMFEVTKRFADVLKAESQLNLKLANMKAEKANLKLDLAVAVVNSYDGDTFWKDDGWINISEVLMKHKLIDLSED